MMPGHASGNSIRQNVRSLLRPQQAAASRTSPGMDSKARCIGCTANGRLKMIDASNSPSNVKTSGDPIIVSYSWPSGDARPIATSR